VNRFIAGIFVALAVTTFTYGAELDLQSELGELKSQVAALENKMDGSGASNSADHHGVAVGYDDGFKISSGDQSLTINGWVMADFKGYEGSSPNNDTFSIRRARLEFNGRVSQHFAYSIQSEFAGTSSTLQRVYLDYDQCKALTIRVGQFTVPFGLENDEYTSRWVHFTERSLASSNLTPADDVGVRVNGSLLGNKIVYALSAVNGSGANATDSNRRKTSLARVVFQPRADADGCACQKMYIGGSYATGTENGTIAGSTYTTASGTAFTTFATGTSMNSTHLRAAGEMEWYLGPFMAGGEYIYSKRKDVTLGAAKDDLVSDAWYVGAAYMLTGEDQVRSGAINPKNEFNTDNGTCGACEFHTRYERFDTENKAFDNAYATGTKKVTATTAGFSWFPNVHVKLVADYIVNDFKDSITVSGVDLSKENAFITRVQFNY
jgi:phosphate-selective porin OprO/OprP